MKCSEHMNEHEVNLCAGPIWLCRTGVVRCFLAEHF